MTANYVPDLAIRDLPKADWAGRDITQEDVAYSCGDPDDWFTPAHRIRYALDALKDYQRWKKPRKSTAWEYGLIVIGGPMGVGKSTIAAHDCRYWYGQGHPCFHGGGFNFSRICQPAEMYSLVEKVPLFASVIFDEAHAGLESNMSGSAGVSNFAQLCAGMRKKRCRMFLPTAMAWMLAPSVKRMAKEVWKPFKPEISIAEGGAPIGNGLQDPRNFVVGIEIWRDYPFESKQDPKAGGFLDFGEPDEILVWGTTVKQRNGIMRAMALTDTFNPVKGGVARQYATKEAQQEILNPQQKKDAELDVQVVSILRRAQLTEMETIAPGYIAQFIGSTGKAVGQSLTRLFGHLPPSHRNQRTREIVLSEIAETLANVR